MTSFWSLSALLLLHENVTKSCFGHFVWKCNSPLMYLVYPNCWLLLLSQYTHRPGLQLTVAQVHAGQAAQETLVALDHDQMKWVRSNNNIKNHAPNWLGANTNNPGGAKEEDTGSCRDSFWGMSTVCCGNQGSKQDHSLLHVRKLLSMSNLQVYRRGNSDLLASGLTN